MNDILFGNNNSEVTTKRLSKHYFKKNKVRNLAATAGNYPDCISYLHPSLPWRLTWRPPCSSLCRCRKAARRDGTFGYMTEEQFEQLEKQ